MNSKVTARDAMAELLKPSATRNASAELFDRVCRDAGLLPDAEESEETPAIDVDEARTQAVIAEIRATNPELAAEAERAWRQVRGERASKQFLDTVLRGAGLPTRR